MMAEAQAVPSTALPHGSRLGLRDHFADKQIKTIHHFDRLAVHAALQGL